MKQMPSCELDSNRKHIEFFKKYQLSTTIQMSLYVCNLLDLQFGLKSNLHRPYKKPNNDPIDIPSNHAPEIPKSLPKTIGRTLFSISSSQEVFQI